MFLDWSLVFCLLNVSITVKFELMSQEDDTCFGWHCNFKTLKKKRLDEIELFKSRKRRIYLITDLQQNTYYKYIPLTVRTCIHTYIHTCIHIKTHTVDQQATLMTGTTEWLDIDKPTVLKRVIRTFTPKDFLVLHVHWHHGRLSGPVFTNFHCDRNTTRATLSLKDKF